LFRWCIRLMHKSRFTRSPPAQPLSTTQTPHHKDLSNVRNRPSISHRNHLFQPETRRVTTVSLPGFIPSSTEASHFHQCKPTHSFCSPIAPQLYGFRYFSCYHIANISNLPDVSSRGGRVVGCCEESWGWQGERVRLGKNGRHSSLCRSWEGRIGRVGCCRTVWRNMVRLSLALVAPDQVLPVNFRPKRVLNALPRQTRYRAIQKEVDTSAFQASRVSELLCRGFALGLLWPYFGR
jgi:hypothetical protein